MRFFLYLTFIGLLTFQFSACTNSDNSETQQLHDEMMKIHDDVMPKMSNINKLSKTIEKILGELEEGTPQYEKSKLAMYDLNRADKAMWDWMNEYADNSQKISEENLAEFYKKEKVKIQEVSDLMLSSIANGEQLVKELEGISAE